MRTQTNATEARKRMLGFGVGALTGLWKAATIVQERQWRRILEEEPARYVAEVFANPVVRVQAEDRMIICPDWWIGHTLPPGSDLVGIDDFVSLDDAVRAAKHECRDVILSCGDSSTSGWDSGVVQVNRLSSRLGRGDALLPLFRYPTYTDLLRGLLEERWPGKYAVLNAGVPAHSSVQGSRRLARLLAAVAAGGCRTAAVVLYYGNNDCAWNANRADVDLLPSWPDGDSSGLLPRLFGRSEYAKVLINRSRRRRCDRSRSRDELRLRVDPLTYKRSIRAMVRSARAAGATPVLVEPLVPFYWRPGERVRGEQLPVDATAPGDGHGFVLAELRRAQSVHRRALARARREPAAWVAELLEAAVEADHVLPRIKATHRRQLTLVAAEERVPLVQVNVPRDRNDGRYFIDYCHPNGEANRLLANAICGSLEPANAPLRHKVGPAPVALQPRYRVYQAAADRLVRLRRTESDSPPRTIYAMD